MTKSWDLHDLRRGTRRGAARSRAARKKCHCARGCLKAKSCISAAEAGKAHLCDTIRFFFFLVVGTWHLATEKLPQQTLLLLSPLLARTAPPSPTITTTPKPPGTPPGTGVKTCAASPHPACAARAVYEYRHATRWGLAAWQAAGLEPWTRGSRRRGGCAAQGRDLVVPKTHRWLIVARPARWSAARWTGPPPAPQHSKPGPEMDAVVRSISREACALHWRVAGVRADDSRDRARSRPRAGISKGPRPWPRSGCVARAAWQAREGRRLRW